MRITPYRFILFLTALMIASTALGLSALITDKPSLAYAAIALFISVIPIMALGGWYLRRTQTNPTDAERS
jgi:hypothetical protein